MKDFKTERIFHEEEWWKINYEGSGPRIKKMMAGDIIDYMELQDLDKLFQFKIVDPRTDENQIKLRDPKVPGEYKKWLYDLYMKKQVYLKVTLRIDEVRLGQSVYHQKIYDGKELMKVVGLRENEVELEGDFSGGTHPINAKDWFPREGIIFPEVKIPV